MLCLCVTVCIMVRVSGCRADSVCAPTAAAQNSSNLPSFEAFYVSCVWAHTHSHTQIWHTDTGDQTDWVDILEDQRAMRKKWRQAGGKGRRKRNAKRWMGRKRREGWQMTYSDGHWGLREVRIAVKENEKQWATPSSDEDRETDEWKKHKRVDQERKSEMMKGLRQRRKRAKRRGRNNKEADLKKRRDE